MKEFIEKLIGRVEENGQKMCEAKSSVPYGKHSPSNHRYYKAISVKKAIHIINQLAEEYKQDIDVPTIDVSELFGNYEQGNDGWISVEDRLPEETECYFVTWRDRATCKNYVEITEYDAGSQEWLDCICQAGLLGYDIIAWKPLPVPYQPKGE